MAAKPTLRSRSIAFYEIVQLKDGEQVRMDHQDWPAVLASMHGADLAAVTWDGGDRPIIGSVYVLEQEDRLALHKLRDESDWMSTVDFSANSIEEVELQAGRGFLDTTAVKFASYGNVVGMMQGAISSPGSVGLGSWLTFLDPFGDKARFVIRPLVTPAEIERLGQASEVSRFEIKLGAQQRRALRGRDGTLARFLSRKIDIDDVTVSVVISVPRGKEHSDARHKFADELRGLTDVIPNAAEIARATVYFGEDESRSSSSIMELVEHNITAKRRVPTVDDEGNSIRLSGAFHVMDSAFLELEDVLREAADV